MAGTCFKMKYRLSASVKPPATPHSSSDSMDQIRQWTSTGQPAQIPLA